MRRVLLTDYAWSDLDIERGILNAVDAELIVAQRKDEEALARLAVDCDAIMTNWARVSESVIAAAERCKIVARLGIGLDNIDVPAATRRGIVVTNVPDYCVVEVAEHALALLLSLSRKAAFYHYETKQGRYNLQAGPALRRIEGQTLGIIGFGNIGRRLAEKAIGLKLNVLATGRARKSQHELPTGVNWCELDQLLQISDYISLHVPLTPETKRMISAPRLARMKPSAYLINTSRGGLIDHAALAAALEAGQLAGAALDVQDPEPPDLTQPPFNDPCVIVTPHAAFVSVESLENLRSRTAQQVATRLQGSVPENVVNPEVLNTAK
ncbi:MAG TPA: C-terminal binding protein [Pirellulales bacterium]|jgi:D-3-phosphoglycerate dehydrogenase|nr:C-terminal binding protein [Pirellulales bacterium]